MGKVTKDQLRIPHAHQPFHFNLSPLCSCTAPPTVAPKPSKKKVPILLWGQGGLVSTPANDDLMHEQMPEFQQLWNPFAYFDRQFQKTFSSLSAPQTKRKRSVVDCGTPPNPLPAELWAEVACHLRRPLPRPTGRNEQASIRQGDLASLMQVSKVSQFCPRAECSPSTTSSLPSSPLSSSPTTSPSRQQPLQSSERQG